MYFSSVPRNTLSRPPTSTPTNAPAEDLNVKYIAKIEERGSSMPFSELRAQEALIPFLHDNDDDAASTPPSTPPQQPYVTPPVYQAQSCNQEHVGYLAGHVSYPDKIEGLIDDEPDRLHPCLVACLDIARAPVVMMIAVFKMLLTICHVITEILWHIPFLYEDPSVRDRDNITDFESGCMSGAKFALLGFYDGFTGLVMLPYSLSRQGGLLGFAEGLLMGIGGVILKPVAGVMAIIGDPCFGIYKEAAEMEVMVKWKVVRGQKYGRGIPASDISSV